MSNTIQNGKNTPLNVKTGTVPDVGGALLDWFQPMTFGIVTKIEGIQVQETVEEIAFRGVIQPMDGRTLMQKPEGERKWNWFQVHAEPQLSLNIDDTIVYLGTQYRVMKYKDFSLYGYAYFEIVEDYTGSGPVPT